MNPDIKLVTGMKKPKTLLALLCAFVASSFLLSCESDIDVTAEWKDITIVYGLLNPNDSVHYLKINKAFLGDGNAIEYAKESDSMSYFGNLEVNLTEIYSNGATRTLQFDTVTLQKNPGVFADKQIFYKSAFKMPVLLDDDRTVTYKLLVRNKLTGKEVKSETVLVHDFRISSPRPGQPTIDFLTDNSQQVKWQSAPNARRYDVFVRFIFQEVFNQTDTTDRYIDWVLGTTRSNTLKGDEDMVMPYIPTSIYEIAASLIPYTDSQKEASVTSRLVDKVVYTVVASGDELNKYLDINGPTSGIIQDRPEYTNIENGLGLFSTRFENFQNPIMIGAQTEAQFIIRKPQLKFVDKIGN